MSRYLMTHSLLSSWLYLMRENPYEDATTERDPMAEFMQTLRREPTPVTQPIQNGIDFEDLVTAILQRRVSAVLHRYDSRTKELKDELSVPTEEHPWYPAALRVADFIRGGVPQYKAQKTVTVDGVELVLYGRLDALKAGGIVDIKFSTGYDRGKYFDSTQHPVYLELIPEAEDFTYIVSNGSEVWTERYRRDETRSIYPVIEDFLSWLRTLGLMDLYREKWEALK